LAQLTVLSIDMRDSKKSMFPSRTFSGVMGLSGDGMDAGSGPKTALALFIRSSSGPAVDSGDRKNKNATTAKPAIMIRSVDLELLTVEYFMVDLLGFGIYINYISKKPTFKAVAFCFTLFMVLKISIR
jgi:hypothetical protein